MYIPVRALKSQCNLEWISIAGKALLISLIFSKIRKSKCKSVDTNLYASIESFPLSLGYGMAFHSSTFILISANQINLA